MNSYIQNDIYCRDSQNIVHYSCIEMLERQFPEIKSFTKTCRLRNRVAVGQIAEQRVWKLRWPARGAGQVGAAAPGRDGRVCDPTIPPTQAPHAQTGGGWRHRWAGAGLVNKIPTQSAINVQWRTPRRRPTGKPMQASRLHSSAVGSSSRTVGS